MIPNRQFYTLIVIIVIIFLAIMTAVFGLLKLFDNPETNKALIGGGLAVSVGLLVSLIVFYKRYKVSADMETGVNLLAHWKYSDFQWLSYAEKEFEISKKESSKLLLKIVSISFAVFGLFYFLNSFQMIFVYLFIAFNLIFVIISIGSVYVTYRRNIKHIGEVLISYDGVMINGKLHIWTGFGSSFENAEIITSEIPMIQFSYIVRSKNGKRRYQARAPIPSDQIESARKIMSQLNRDN